MEKLESFWEPRKNSSPLVSHWVLVFACSVACEKGVAAPNGIMIKHFKS